VIFRTVPLTRGEWGSCIVVGSTVLLWSALLKLTPDSLLTKLASNRFINEDEELKSKLLDGIASAEGKGKPAPPKDEPTETEPDEDNDNDNYQQV